MTQGLQPLNDFCRKHGISRDTAYRYCNSGSLKLTKVGRLSHVSPSHEAEWLASLPIMSRVAA